MKYALSLARKGYGHVFPNPPVGAVIVNKGRIIGSGFHKKAGGHHAEIDALSDLKKTDTGGSTMYVTLEPCKHTGRTPPCVNAILAAGISRVVIGTKDVSEEAGGGGVILESQGLTVEYSGLATFCKNFVEPWRKWTQSGVKSVELFAILSLNGLLFTENNNTQEPNSGSDVPLKPEIERVFRKLCKNVQGVEAELDSVAGADSYHTLHRVQAPDCISKLVADEINTERLYRLNILRVPYMVKKSENWTEWGVAVGLESAFKLEDVRIEAGLILERYIKN